MCIILANVSHIPIDSEARCSLVLGLTVSYISDRKMYPSTIFLTHYHNEGPKITLASDPVSQYTQTHAQAKLDDVIYNDLDFRVAIDT